MKIAHQHRERIRPASQQGQQQVVQESSALGVRLEAVGIGTIKDGPYWLVALELLQYYLLLLHVCCTYVVPSICQPVVLFRLHYCINKRSAERRTEKRSTHRTHDLTVEGLGLRYCCKK